MAQGEVIKQFLVGLGFKVDEAGLGKFNAGIQKAGVAVLGIGTAIAGAVAGITAFANAEAKQLSTLGNLSNRTNTAADDIERFGYIASMTGSSAETATAALESMSNVMGQAATGVGRGAKYFEKFGLHVRKSNGEVKSTTEMMAEIGAYIKDMSRPEQMSVLNRLGLDPSMLRMLTEDTSALTAEFDNINRILGVDKDKAIKTSKELLGVQKRISHLFKELREAIAVKIMPQITRGYKKFYDMLMANLPKIVEKTTAIINAILRITGALFDLNDATNGVLGMIMGMLAAWKLLNVAFLASPIGIVLALAAAIALLYDDFMVWKEGGEALIDWSKWGPAMELAIEYVGMLGDVIKTAFGGAFDVASMLFSLIEGFFTGDFTAYMKKAIELLNKFLGLWDRFKAFGKGAAERVLGMMSGAPYVPATAGYTAGGGNTASMNANTTINVNGSGDPAAVGREVADRQNTVNKNLARNLAPVTG